MAFNKAIPRVLASRMKALSRLLEKIGYGSISAWTDKALDLHDYQYYGLDPDLEFSKYINSNDAVNDVLMLLKQLAVYVDSIKGRVKWSSELDGALGKLREGLIQ